MEYDAIGPITNTTKDASVGEQIEMAVIASPDITDSDMELLDKESITEGTISFPGENKGKGSLRRGMNLLDSIAYIVGSTIGSGVYITPALILEKTGSFGVSMMCWFAGMFIAIFGGLCYVELGLLIPKTGAEYVYILQGYSFKNRNKWTELFGSLMAFLYTWTSIIIISPTSTSIIILTCSRYLIRPIYIDCDIPEGAIKCVAISILSKKWKRMQMWCSFFSIPDNIFLIPVLHAVILSRSVKFMAKISTFITIVKVLSIVFIVVVGVAGIIKKGVVY